MGGDKTELLQALAIDRKGDDRPRRRAALWPKLAAGAVVLVLLGAAWLLHEPTGGTERAAVNAEPAATSQRPAAAPSEPARTGLSASGYIVARRKATVAAEITGKVAEVLIEEGMVVEAGQVLARLDSVLAEHDLALARSKVAAADAAAQAIAADLQDAERILRRSQTLSRSSNIAEADLTKAESHVGVLRAQLGQAKAQLETATVDANRAAAVLDKHAIRAPFAGVIVERSAQPGEMISPMSAGGFTRTGICTIVDMDSIEVEVEVNEAFIGRVRAGGPVSAVLDAYPSWTIPASVIAIIPTANREKATVKVRIALKQKDPRVLPDMGVKVTFLDDGGAAGADTAATAAKAAAN
jgi:RND family efflux transporter MFP subunit